MYDYDNLFVALFYDNSDGEGMVYPVLCKSIDGEICYEDNDSPLLQYKGDRILKLWKLDQQTEYRNTVNDWQNINCLPVVDKAIDVLLKDGSGNVTYGIYTPYYKEFDSRKTNFFAEFWQYII